MSGAHQTLEPITAQLTVDTTLHRWRYLYVSPDHWWRTELWYIVLSLTSKMFLGLFLYTNVLRLSSVDEALDARN